MAAAFLVAKLWMPERARRRDPADREAAKELTAA